MQLGRLVASLLLLALAGCDNPNTVSFSARASTGQALTLANGITVSRVRMVVRAIKLEQVNQGVATELAVGPYLIDLKDQQLDGGIHQVFEVAAPVEGTYQQLKLRFHKIEEGDVQGNAAFAEMKDVTIRVEGTKDGNAFTYNSSLSEEQSYQGTFRLGAGRDNFSLNINPSGWFAGAGGGVLDPRDSTNRSIIESNIKASINVIDDDDRNGRSDN